MAKKYIDAEKLKAMMQPEYDRNKAFFKKTGERYVEGIMDGLDIVEQFIDSLQQEQPSEGLEKEVDNYIENERYFPDDERELVLEIARKFYDLGKQSKEPVSEDLEEAAIDYADYARKQPKDYAISSIVDYDHGCIDGFKAGAEWQRMKLFEEGLDAVRQDSPSKIEKTIAGVFVKYGMDRMKREMLKDAVERTVKIDSGGYPYIDITVELYDYEHNVPLAKEGELVKIIIVKED